MAKGVVIGGLNSGGGSVIKSIQRGTFTAISATSWTQAISSIDITKSIVRLNYDSDNLPVNLAGITVKILDATTLQFDSYTGSSGRVISWEVIEFNNVKSLQKGEVAITDLVDVVISSVDVNKSLIFTTVRHANAGGASSTTHFYFVAESKFTTATNLNLKMAQSTGGSIVSWQVVEFQ